MKMKKGDNVIVTSGKYKGSKGKIAKVVSATNRVIISGVGSVKRHIRAKNKNEKGSIVEQEAAIHNSNVMVLDPKTNTPTRLGKKLVDGKMVRFAKKSNQELK
jgi:large subunit ribosomal protein L24